MDKSFFLKNNGKTNHILTAISLASTWIWTPAIFVSSEIAAHYNILGLLFFLIPNVLTLLIFGYFASRINIADQSKQFTIFDLIKSKGTSIQYYTHLAIGCILLICLCAIQLIGIKILITTLFPTLNVNFILLLILLITTLYISVGGIKNSIYTDVVKYLIMITCIGFILFLQPINNISLQLYDTSNLVKSFGIPTILGLMFAPYVDQTFWQRIYSIEHKNIMKMCYWCALFFAIVPLFFGIIGLTQFPTMSFNIVQYFSICPFNILIFTIVLSTLISTLDSGFSALTSIIWNEFDLKDKSYFYSILSIIVVSALAFLIVLSDIKIVSLFLIYGTIRTSTGLPTMLMILDRYDKNILQYTTLLSAVLCSLGFIYCTLNRLAYGFIFTFIAAFISIIAYRKQKL